MYTIDLNCDMGESYGVYSLGQDKEIMPYVTSVNIACGWHAGDPLTMSKTIARAKAHNLAIGAHPGFPDLMGFGRRQLAVTPRELKAYVVYQLGAINAFARLHHHPLTHVKPHGAMYNMASEQADLARAIAEAVYEVDPHLCLFGLANSELIRQGEAIGLACVNEVFADRGYDKYGRLAPRHEAGAMIHDLDEAVTRVVRMIQTHRVKSIDGHDIPITPETLCVHGDNPHALDFLKALSQAFEKQGISAKCYDKR